MTTAAKLPLVLTTPAANLSPVSTILVANFATIFACVVDTVASGFRHLKVNLKAKIYIFVNSTTQRCPNKVIKFFLIEDFFHLPLVSLVPVVHLEPRISPRNGCKVHSGTWGKLIHEKKQKSKILWHCPFNGLIINQTNKCFQDYYYY
jgi:hypothetical protein